MLGQGAFGSVEVDKQDRSQAIKQFKCLEHLVAEAFPTRHASSKWTVKLTACNPKTLTMKTERWSASLDKVLRHEFLSLEQKRSIHCSILKGLTYLESIHIVHSDLKPSNILVDAKRTKAVLADFGLSSSSNSAKVNQTALAFSPKAPQSHRTHDMFGFVIVTLELFHGYRVTTAIPTRQELREIVANHVKDPKTRTSLCNLIKDELTQCTRAKDLLKDLYSKAITTIPNNQVKVELHQSVDEDTKLLIITRVTELRERHHFRKGQHCIEALNSFFSTLNVPSSKVEVYITVMAYIFSCVFGRSQVVKREQRLSLSYLVDCYDLDAEEIYRCITNILNNRRVLNIMFF